MILIRMILRRAHNQFAITLSGYLATYHVIRRL